MDIQKEIAAIEAALEGRGASLADFLKDAGVSRSTWNRWKNGSILPSLRKWNKVTRRFDAIMRRAA